MLKDFKEFAIRGNVVDMAVGIIIGAAFTSVVQSLVKDILMPPIGLLTGGIDFTNAFIVLQKGVTPPPYTTIQAAQEAGAVVLRYGTFINAVISFTIVAFAVFMLVRYINKLKTAPKKEEEKEAVSLKVKKCDYCFTEIPVEASRCPHCTSKLEE